MIVMSAKNVTVAMLGTCYVAGSTAYEDDESARAEITLINKKIYNKSDAEINKLYDIGRRVSLEHFETLYKRLGSTFDFHFYESESAVLGCKIVLDFLEKGVFEKSDGAVIFRGEKYGLHTRVFLNKEGIPTYEAKEVGLAKIKRKAFAADCFITVTANEQDSFFKVVEKAIGEIFGDGIKDGISDGKGTMIHVSHGLLRFSSEKMTSRKGNIISAESFIDDVKALVVQRIADRDIPKDEKDAIAETVAIGAIKYTILRQSVGADVIFDPTAAISFEGDSGPYLQYSTVRAKSIREKAAGEGIAAHVGAKEAAKMAAKNEKSAAKSENKNTGAYPPEISTLEKLLYRFPEIVERTALEYEPHYVTTYLVELAAAFNNYYAKNQIVLKSDPASPYKVALTHAFEIVMRNGLHLLGIGVPERM
jgi:arginyl-tRNA synthetase